MTEPTGYRLRLCAVDGALVEQPTHPTPGAKRRALCSANSKKHNPEITHYRQTKKDFHTRIHQQARVEAALACLDFNIEPAEIVMHIEDSAKIERSLKPALDWLRRFAMEFENREQSGGR